MAIAVIEHSVGVRGIGTVLTLSVKEDALRPGMKTVIEGTTIAIDRLEQNGATLVEAKQGTTVLAHISVVQGDAEQRSIFARLFGIRTSTQGCAVCAKARGLDLQFTT